jgi:hypothetical protein
MRASSGGPPSRKNSVNGITDSQPKNVLVIEKAVLPLSTGVRMAGVPPAAGPPCVS